MYASLGCGALSVPLGVTLDSAETPLLKPPLCESAILWFGLPASASHHNSQILLMLLHAVVGQRVPQRFCVGL